MSKLRVLLLLKLPEHDKSGLVSSSGATTTGVSTKGMTFQLLR